MLRRLYQSDRVQKELTEFSKQIKLINNSDVQQKALRLLEKLKQRIQDLDEGHTSNLIGDLRPNLMTFVKDDVTQMRRDLHMLIKQNT